MLTPIVLLSRPGSSDQPVTGRVPEVIGDGGAVGTVGGTATTVDAHESTGLFAQGLLTVVGPEPGGGVSAGS
jgi:hypothetical protein